MPDLAALSLSAPSTPPLRPWRMPLTPDRYDRGPLTADERDALAIACTLDHGTFLSARGRAARAALDRLTRPLDDVRDLGQVASTTGRSHSVAMRRVVFAEMLARGAVFWQWSPDEWRETIGTSPDAYVRRHGSTARPPDGGGRGALRKTAYFLGEVSDLRSVGLCDDATHLAHIAFDPEASATELARILTMLATGQGYSARIAEQGLAGMLNLLALLCRSPYLDAIGSDILLDVAREAIAIRYRERYCLVRQVSDALHRLGLIDEADLDRVVAVGQRTRPAHHRSETAGIAPAWVAWCMAWRDGVVDIVPESRDKSYAQLLGVGRWLSREHPDVVSPEQWDAALAHAYVRYACGATAGADAQPVGRVRLATQGRLGHPLAAQSIGGRLGTLRRFFSDVQDRPHTVAGLPARSIALRFKPDRAFRTPRAVKRRIQPDPRDIDLAVWHKLMGAAARLRPEDLGANVYYPFEFVRAAAFLWVTSARRPNEIVRLRVGCIRRDWDPEMLDDDGQPVDQDAQFIYLHVPLGKTSGPFWIPIPAFTADAIEAWERIRPAGQPRLRDPKDGADAKYLFCYRGKRIGKNWLCRTLIPLLCRTANVNATDARGKLTPHRGRSTIATLLRRAGVPLDNISTFLGHRSPDMVRRYAREDPFQHARAMRQADVLVRTMMGLYDPSAAAHGLPSVFFYLAYGPDKRPRLCASPQHLACPHRLRCVQCAMFLDAEEAEALERKPGVLQVGVAVPMEPEDTALERGDKETLDAILDRRKHLPPPEPPGPAFHVNKWLGQPEGQVPTSYLIAKGDVEALQARLTELIADLEGMRQRHKDGRNQLVRTFIRQIAQIEEGLRAIQAENR